MEWKNTMRFFAAASIAGCMLAFASGCGKKDRAAVPSGESKKLVMVTEAMFPPYEYMENSKIVGIDPEIVGEIAVYGCCDLPKIIAGNYNISVRCRLCCSGSLRCRCS